MVSKLHFVIQDTFCGKAGNAMKYAIVINLDYSSFHQEDCRFVWNAIKEGMSEAGFVIDKRLLIINLDEDEACDRARSVIAKLNRSKRLKGIDIYSYLKDFYAYDHSNSVNLLIPEMESMMLEFR